MAMLRPVLTPAVFASSLGEDHVYYWAEVNPERGGSRCRVSNPAPVTGTARRKASGFIYTVRERAERDGDSPKPCPGKAASLSSTGRRDTSDSRRFSDNRQPRSKPYTRLGYVLTRGDTFLTATSSGSRYKSRKLPEGEQGAGSDRGHRRERKIVSRSMGALGWLPLAHHRHLFRRLHGRTMVLTRPIFTGKARP